jgi:hypothetical protein
VSAFLTSALEELASFTPRPLYLKERNLSTHKIGGSENRSGCYGQEKTKSYNPAWNRTVVNQTPYTERTARLLILRIKWVVSWLWATDCKWRSLLHLRFSCHLSGGTKEISDKISDIVTGVRVEIQIWHLLITERYSESLALSLYRREKSHHYQSEIWYCWSLILRPKLPMILILYCVR